MSNIKSLVIGSDPEFLIRNSDNEVVSAIDYISGTKDYPLVSKHGMLQHDNIMAEVNSNPSSTLEEFILNHSLIMKDLEDHISKYNLHVDYSTSAHIASEMLLLNPATMRSGCEPDYNAWSDEGRETNRPPSYFSNNMRAAGGHIHISFDQAEEVEGSRVAFARTLDMILGVPSVILDVNGGLRKELYGKAGAVRYKHKSKKDPYDGIEYRVLSNFWVGNKELQTWVWDGVNQVYSNLEELYSKALYHKDTIIEIINNNNTQLASQFCKSELLL
jgi:hypothetical protein